MNSSLALSQGDKLNGTVKLNVTYNKASQYSTFAILTTTDIPDKTNREKLAVTPGSSSEIDPIRCSTVDEMKKFPGDLLAVEATCIDLTWGEFQINGRSFYTSNQSKYKNDIEQYGSYDMTVWFDADRWSNPKVKIVK